MNIIDWLIEKCEPHLVTRILMVFTCLVVMIIACIFSREGEETWP